VNIYQPPAKRIEINGYISKGKETYYITELGSHKVYNVVSSRNLLGYHLKAEDLFKFTLREVKNTNILGIEFNLPFKAKLFQVESLKSYQIS
jgi:hypothetical protein